MGVVPAIVDNADIELVQVGCINIGAYSYGPHSGFDYWGATNGSVFMAVGTQDYKPGILPNVFWVNEIIPIFPGTQAWCCRRWELTKQHCADRGGPAFCMSRFYDYGSSISLADLATLRENRCPGEKVLSRVVVAAKGWLRARGATGIKIYIPSLDALAYRPLAG